MKKLKESAKTIGYIFLFVCLFLFFTCGLRDSTLNESTSAVTKGDKTFKMQAWADNWFAAYLEETLVIEDSVSITTERSFNAESVTFKGDYPLHLNFVLKDFKENDTGLEYIGSRKQQMGDGGFIMQLSDVSTGKVIAVSDEKFKCLVIHEAPLDKTCEKESSPTIGKSPCDSRSSPEPPSWKSKDFDDSDWKPAFTFTKSQVSPKDGYDAINWDSKAKLIWGDDLETSNTILCRVTINSPK